MSEQNWGSGEQPNQPPQYGQQPQYGQPPKYGQMPPVSSQGYGPPQPAYPYASWISRVGAYLLDYLIVPLPGVIVAIIGAVIAFSGAEVTTYDDGTVTTEGANSVGLLVIGIGIVLTLLIEVWNYVFRQGNTGQSLGKKWLGISVVRESDGVPLGPPVALLRWILEAILGGACFLNYLWPLWDSKSQCWHDMIVRSVVIRAR